MALILLKSWQEVVRMKLAADEAERARNNNGGDGLPHRAQEERKDVPE